LDETRRVVCDMEPERCHDLLSTINDGVVKIETKANLLEGHVMKIFYGMLALIAATMGVEFIGTPWYVHVSAYSTWFAGVFLLSVTLARWKYIKTRSKILGIEFSAMMLFSIFIRTFMYEVGAEPPPPYLGWGINFFYILIAVTLIVIAWKYNGETI
jgi:hypothetical protein